MTDRTEHERRLIESFVLPECQSRYLELLSKPKRRKDVTSALSHFKYLDMRFAFKIPAASRLAPGILALLKSKGAPDSCFVVSEAERSMAKKSNLVKRLSSFLDAGLELSSRAFLGVLLTLKAKMGISF